MTHRGIRPSTTESTRLLWAKSVLNAVLFFAIFMVALPSIAYWLLPVVLPLPLGLRLAVTAPAFLGGIGLWIYCLDVFSRRGRGTPFPLDAPRRLVTDGPYRVLRNPIMAAEMAVIWGESVYFANLGMLIYAALLTLAGHLLVVLIEEPELHERFGAQYEDYCRGVPRWLPTFS